ncbi:MAG: type IV secretory system conjugative DNA transfer family protein, partial [Clostridia bacterium]|nr:type IV secretory system conjugative DNA transfer family protein [Clostridia bacterium]
MCEKSVLLTPKTVENSFVTVDISKPYSLGGGITIGNYVEGGTRKILVAPEGHTLLIGSTGSGKTESFYLPQIEIMGRSKDHLSFVVMDMKGNMFRQKSEMLKKNGFKVVVLNGKNPFASSKYNPLSVIFRAYRRAKDAEKQFLDKTAQKFEFMGKVFDDYLEYRFEVEQFINKNMAYCYQMIDQISEIVIPIEGKDPSWDYGAREIFKSMIYLLLEDSDSKVNPLTEEQFTFYNIAKSLNCRGSDYATLISYVNRHNEDNPGRKLLNYIDSQARQTRDSFMMGACDKLNRIVNLPLNTMSAYSDIDIDELVKSLDTQRTAIFLIADSANKSIYTLCNMFLIQLIVALQRVGDENPKGDFHILADEFCNMVPMPDIIDWITTMRSRRTWFHLGIQSYSQLEHHYSAEERYTIEGNSKTIFMGSNDFKTLESFSQAAGLTMKVANTYSVDNNGNMSLSLSSANAPLVRISDLANMTLGEAYVKMFGSFGNKLIKTVLDPDFKIAEFAHGNAEPEVVKGHSVSAEENAYDIRQSNKRNKLADSDEDEDLYNPFSKDPFDRMFMPPRPINTMDERKVQS